ncbi:uncharacterized protein XB22063249.S [Xenopus laevis]|uniref:Uncharacterized protein XB22063249.S n=1 Tax=Xenopus laevis TaxID=8355 RepID=A0A8J0U0S6_XENLA|nr:uncharacterized protein XB22063249.S [Xenopus laevis]
MKQESIYNQPWILHKTIPNFLLLTILINGAPIFSYQYSDNTTYEYNISFSFGRFQPKSEDGQLILSHGTQQFISWKDQQPYIRATIYINATGYWLGEESALPNESEKIGVSSGTFRDDLKDGKYVLECSVTWRDTITPRYIPRKVSLMHTDMLGFDTEKGSTSQQGIYARGGTTYQYLKLFKTISYQSYREALGVWKCEDPDTGMEIGELNIVDDTPDYFESCKHHINITHPNNIEQPPHLEKGQPFQVNLDSKRMLVKNVKYTFATWHFNLSQWLIKTYYKNCEPYTLNQINALHRWMIPKDIRKKVSSNYQFFHNTSTRTKRDIFGTILGGVGAGLGALNKVDIEVLRNKLSNIASHSKDGLVVQKEINNIINNLEEDNMNTHVEIAKDFVNHFKILVDNVFALGKNTSWAIACTQGQTELSSNMKLIVQSIYNGQWPFELLPQISAALPNYISFTHPKWWTNAWVGCMNHDFENCYASSLIPFTDQQFASVYRIISIGILAGENTILHPRLEYPHAVREQEIWKQVDISLCPQRNHDVLCSLGQYREIDEKCWKNASICVLDGENISRDRPPVYYLGQNRVCFFAQNNTSVSLVTNQNCAAITPVSRGAWCTLGEITEIRTPTWSYKVPVITNFTADFQYQSPITLKELNLGMGKEIYEWLIKFDKDELLLKKLQQNQAKATIIIHHDQSELKTVSNLLEGDSKGHWWETLFGHSSQVNTIMNYLIHPVIVLLMFSALLTLLQVYMCCVTRFLHKKVTVLSMKVEAQRGMTIASAKVETLLPVRFNHNKSSETCSNCQKFGHGKEQCVIPKRNITDSQKYDFHVL